MQRRNAKSSSHLGSAIERDIQLGRSTKSSEDLVDGHRHPLLAGVADAVMVVISYFPSGLVDVLQLKCVSFWPQHIGFPQAWQRG